MPKDVRDSHYTNPTINLYARQYANRNGVSIETAIEKVAKGFGVETPNTDAIIECGIKADMVRANMKPAKDKPLWLSRLWKK